MKKTRKPVALLLSALMLLALFAPLSVVSFAADDETPEDDIVTVVETGDCGAEGSEVRYTLYSDGTMIIRGNGVVKEKAFEKREDITALWVKDGITGIGKGAFSECRYMKTLSLADTVKAVDDFAFLDCFRLSAVAFGNGLESIGEDSFRGFPLRGPVILPDSLKTIALQAFEYTDFKTIVFGTGLEYAESGALYCTCVDRVALLNGNTVIGENNQGDLTWMNAGYGPTIYSYAGGSVEENAIVIDRTFVDLSAIEETDHDWSADVITKLPTCTEPGVKTSVCLNNPTHRKTEEIPMTGHTYVETTAPGKRVYTCIYCGDSYDEADPALTVVKTGQIGPDVYYTLYENGHADIYGTGDTYERPSGYGSYFSEETNWQTPVPVTSIEVHPDVTGLLWEYGFSDLRDLRTVKLPASLVTIAPNMFYFCTGLESLELDPENPSYTVEDDVLFNKEKTRLIQYPLGKKDTTYAAPDGVEVIGAKAFCELQYLEELTLPDTVRTIERQVFEEAKSLRKVDLGNSVEFIDECAFFRADNIPVITIPGSVKHIGNWAFGFRPDFTDVYYPCPKEAWDAIEIGSANEPLLNANFHFGAHVWDDGVYTVYPTETTPGEKACTCTVCGLEGLVEVPATLYQDWLYTASPVRAHGQIGEHVAYTLYMDGHAFIYGTGDTYTLEHYVPHDYYYNMIVQCYYMTSLEVCDGVTGLVCKGGLSNSTNLETVKLPASLVSIHPTTFEFCSALRAFDVDPENPAYMAADGVLFNKDQTALLTYPAAKPGETYHVPAGVITIGDRSFLRAAALKTVTLPDSTKTIGYHAFGICPNLETIQIGAGTETIGNYAFASCENLQSIRISGSVKSIGTGAFRYDDNFTDVYYDCPKEAWDAIEIGPIGMDGNENDELLNANFHFGDHDWDGGVITAPATCGKDGVKTFTCQNCGNTYTETISATGAHSYQGVVTTAATCEADGVKTFTCTVCGGSYTETLAATGHNWSDWIVTRNPSETREGEAYRFCKNDPSHIEHKTLEKLPQTSEGNPSFGERVRAWIQSIFDRIGEAFRMLFSW